MYDHDIEADVEEGILRVCFVVLPSLLTFFKDYYSNSLSWLLHLCQELLHDNARNPVHLFITANSS